MLEGTLLALAGFRYRWQHIGVALAVKLDVARCLSSTCGVARFIFRYAFPMGTVFEEQHMELVRMPGASVADAVNDVAEDMGVEPVC